MRLELTRLGLLVELANHYTTKGAYQVWYDWFYMPSRIRIHILLKKFPVIIVVFITILFFNKLILQLSFEHIYASY